MIDRDKLKRLVKHYYSCQKLRVGIGNRFVSTDLEEIEGVDYGKMGSSGQ